MAEMLTHAHILIGARNGSSRRFIKKSADSALTMLKNIASRKILTRKTCQLTISTLHAVQTR